MNDFIYSIDVANADASLLAKLKSLTHGPDGYMTAILDLCYRMRVVHDKDDFTCLLYIFKIKSSIVGWAIVQDLLYRHEDYLDLSIYVSPLHRKQGIASAIMHSIQDENSDKKISVWVDNKSNEKLFAAFKGEVFTPFDSDAYSKDKSYKLYNFDK